ncbi:hypothetical protein H4R24_001318 [Coemansia sp. RSA 988]|nr:hypothetical protein H4R24_001318 [Coemansia sp. RSA 988]
MAQSTFLGVFSQTARLKPRAQQQILNVYSTLASTTASSVAGYYAADRFSIIEANSTLLAIGALLLSAAVFLMKPTSSNISQRRTILWGIVLITGALLHPAIAPLMYIGYADVVYMALGVTAALFGSFSVAVMTSDRAQVVYGIGAATYAVLSLSWVGLINWFYPTRALSSLSLLLGLAMPCISVVINTSSMLEQASLGEDIDPVSHSLAFFNDLVRMFVNLLVLLSGDKNRRDEEDYQNGKPRRKSHGNRQFYRESGTGFWE